MLCAGPLHGGVGRDGGDNYYEAKEAWKGRQRSGAKSEMAFLLRQHLTSALGEGYKGKMNIFGANRQI